MSGDADLSLQLWACPMGRIKEQKYSKDGVTIIKNTRHISVEISFLKSNVPLATETRGGWKSVDPDFSFHYVQLTYSTAEKSLERSLLSYKDKLWSEMISKVTFKFYENMDQKKKNSQKDIIIAPSPPNK